MWGIYGSLLCGEFIEVKGSYHSFQSFGKLRDNGFLGAIL